MSDYGDFCREQRQRKQEFRRSKAHENWAFVEEAVQWTATRADLPGGYRFTLRDGQRVDFWPSSGKWTVVGSNVYRNDPRGMIKWMKAHTTKEGKIETQGNVTPKETEWTGRPTGPGNPPWED